MEISTATVIAQPLEQVWEFVRSVEELAPCVPGVSDVTSHGEDEFSGTLQARVGGITVRLEGTINVESIDDKEYSLNLSIRAVEKRLGGAVEAQQVLSLTALAPDRTELQLDTSAAVLGKLGQFGQGVARRVVQKKLEVFGDNVNEQLKAQRGDTEMRDVPPDTPRGTLSARNDAPQPAVNVGESRRKPVVDWWEAAAGLGVVAATFGFARRDYRFLAITGSVVGFLTIHIRRLERE